MKDFLTERTNTIIINVMGNPLLTNCYLSYADLMKEIESGGIHCYCYESTLVLVHPMDGFQKMYYFIEEPDTLNSDTVSVIRKDLRKYPDLIAEVVARIPEKNTGIIEKLGFHPYRKYIRKQLVTGTENTYEKVIRPEQADINDLDDIYLLLYHMFDIMSDHLVSREELHTLLESSQVLKICIDKKLAGVLLFETFGKKSYLRSICVADEFMGKNAGLSLLQNYIERNRESTKLFYLWVESTNKKAIRLYEKFGYKDDGLRQYIYLKDK